MGLVVPAGGTIVLAMKILALLLLAAPLYAHNGAVAIAVPVEGIVVDGDLSDWQDGRTDYGIARLEYHVSRLVIWCQ